MKTLVERVREITLKEIKGIMKHRFKERVSSIPTKKKT